MASSHSCPHKHYGIGFLALSHSFFICCTYIVYSSHKGKGSAPAGAGYFYNAIKVAKSASRLRTAQRVSHIRKIESCRAKKTAPDFPVPSRLAAYKRRRKNAPRSFRNFRCRRLGAWRSLKSSLFKQIPRPIAPYRRPVAKHPIFFRRERCQPQVGGPQWFWLLWP